jgi:ANTAR domain
VLPVSAPTLPDSTAFPDRTAALLSLAAATQERSLSQLTALAASEVPGCAAADVTVWRDGELASQASSHPEPSRLVAAQVASGRGPLIDAVTTGNPVGCADTLTETRWPEFTAAALRIGVRSTVTLSRSGQVVIALSLHGLRPRAVELGQAQLADLLVAYGGALVGAVSDYDESRRVASQLRDAADSRAVVDQAKGILMHALGCSADEALDRMREVSQRSNLRATEVARRVIDAHTRPGGRGELDQLAGLAGGRRQTEG